MATVKNFGLVGVGSSVQFGKSNGRLKASSATNFQFNNAADSALVTVEVATPTGATHAATKGYVDNLVQGISAKSAVRAATTTAGTLATSFADGSVIDGVTLATNDRILIKDQATASENGIYVVQASGAPVRSTDMDAWTEVPGSFVFVEEGTSNADTGWLCSSDQGGTIDTDPINFVQFSSAGTVTASNGLTKVGNDIQLDLAGLGSATSTGSDSLVFVDASDANNEKITTVSNFISDNNLVLNTRAINTAANSGLAGGGNLTADRSLSLDVNNLAAAGADAATGDLFAGYDASATATKSFTLAELSNGVASTLDLSGTYQPLDADLTALANTVTTGLYVITGDGASATTTISGTPNQISVASGDGISGSPTIAIVDDVILPGTGAMTVPTGNTAQQPGSPTDGMIRYNSESDLFEFYQGGTWVSFGSGSGSVTSVAATAPTEGFSITGSPITTSGTFVFTLTNDLAGVEGLTTHGYAVRTADDTWTTRSIVDATNGGLSISNGDGISGDTSIALAVNDLAANGADATTGNLFAGYNGESTVSFTIDEVANGVAASLDLSGTYQPLDSDLTALANTSTTGMYVVTGSGTSATRTIVDATNGGITVTNGTGVAGNPTLALNVNDLAAAGENAATGDLFAAYNLSGTATQSFTLAQLSNGVSTSLNLAGTYQPLDATLTSLAAYNTNGFLVQTAADTFAGRSIAGTTNTITVTNGSGVAGNPTITIADNAVFPGTGAVTIPASTTANQPTAANGMIRYDTDTNKVMAVVNGAWTTVVTGTVDQSKIFTGANTYVDTNAIAGNVVVNVLDFAGTGTIRLLDAKAGTNASDSGLVLTNRNISAGLSDVRMEATGSDTDIDIRLVPKGAGQVLIGDPGVTATIAASDNSAGNGENLVVKAGSSTGSNGNGGSLTFTPGALNGTGTNGNVVITDSASNNVATFNGVSTAVNYISMTNSATTNNVVIASAGSDTNIGLTLTAKGTGQLNLDGTTFPSGGIAAGSILAANSANTLTAVTAADGTGNLVLTYNDSTNTIVWAAPATSGTVTSVAATAPAAGFTISGSPITSSGTFVFTLANDLAAVEGLATNGIAVRTATDTWTTRTISDATNGGLTVTNGDGVSGNPTLALNVNDLTAASADLATGDFLAGYDASATATRKFALSDVANGVATQLNLAGTYQPLDADLTAIAAFSGTGFAVRTASNTWAQRTIVADTSAGKQGVSLTNGDGVAGNATVGLNINGLSASGSLTGTETVAIFDGTNNVKTTTQAIANLAGADPLARRASVTTSASTNIGTVLPTNAYVTRVIVNVGTAYDVGADMTITAAGGVTALAGSTDIDLQTTGIYIVDLGVTGVSTGQIVATITGSPTGGASTVTVEYKVIS